MFRKLLWGVSILVLLVIPFSGTAGADGDDDHGGGDDDSHQSDDDHGSSDDDHGGGDDDDGGGGGTTTLPDDDCDDYTPTYVSVDPSSAQPGDTITIAGMGKPGDTVTVTITGPNSSGGGNDDDHGGDSDDSNHSGGDDDHAEQDDDAYYGGDDDDSVNYGDESVTLNAGSATVQPDGSFTLTYTLPGDLPPGTYTVTITSTQCPISTETTLNVIGVRDTDCSSSRWDRTFVQGENTNWHLRRHDYNQTKPVTLRLVRGPYSEVLYSGPWPANDTVSIEFPANAQNGKYKLEQEGIKKNTSSTVRTKRCNVWVVLDTANVVANNQPVAKQGSPLPVLIPVIVMIAIASLVRLRLARFTRRT